MNQFQNLSFSSKEEFLDYLPKHERIIVERLRSIIFECLLKPKEKLSYNVPFYSNHSSVCFIWPSSIPWGKVKKYGVILGFSKGYLMRDEIGYLENGDRKQVRTKTFFDVKEIDPALVKTYIFEALEIDMASK